MTRAVGAISPFVLIPISVRYLGSEVFGVWMAIASLTSMALWADLGLGNGLTTKLAAVGARGDWATARKYVSSAYIMLGAVAGAGCITVLALSPFIPWSTLVGHSHGLSPSTVRTIALECIFAFLLNIPLALVQRVQYGCQEVTQSNIWQAAGSIAGVVLAAVAIASKLSPQAVIGLSVLGPPLTNLVNSIVIYVGRHRNLAPGLRYVQAEAARSLTALGTRFLLLSVITSVATNTDALVISHVIGASAVTNYTVPSRLFSAVGLLLTLVNLPLWPANGEALARGDIGWVVRTTRRMTLVSGVAAAVAGCVLVVGAADIISRWVSTSSDVSYPLLVGLAAWWLPLAVTSPMLMVQNAAGVLRPQLLGWAAFLTVSVPLKVVAAAKWGIGGVACVDAGVYLVTVLPAALVGYRLAVESAWAAKRRNDVWQSSEVAPSSAGPTGRATGRHRLR